jgi:hypothetical protein
MAYALAAIEHEATGDDTTLLLVGVEATLSRTRLLAELRNAGIAARIVAGAPAEKRAPAPVLLEAEGFVPENDPRLAAFVAQTGGSAFPAGGFANPAVPKDAAP